jgi:hypothetical protein
LFRIRVNVETDLRRCRFGKNPSGFDQTRARLAEPSRGPIVPARGLIKPRGGTAKPAAGAARPDAVSGCRRAARRFFDAAWPFQRDRSPRREAAAPNRAPNWPARRADAAEPLAVWPSRHVARRARGNSRQHRQGASPCRGSAWTRRNTTGSRRMAPPRSRRWIHPAPLVARASMPVRRGPTAADTAGTAADGPESPSLAVPDSATLHPRYARPYP